MAGVNSKNYTRYGIFDYIVQIFYLSSIFLAQFVIFWQYPTYLKSEVLLLLVRCFRLRWDSHNNDSSLLHVLGSGHDEGKQLAALIPRLTNKKHHGWKSDTSNSVQIKASPFTVWIQFNSNEILTEWTKAFRRYLQRRDKAMGFEKSFTSGVPYTWKSRKVLSWAGYTVKKQPHTHLQVIQTLIPPWGSSRGRVPETGWGWYRCSWLQSAGWLSASS